MLRALFAILAVVALVAPAVAAASPEAGLDALYQKLWGTPEMAKPTMPTGKNAVPQRIVASLQERYGVEVIRADREQIDGKPVYRLVVMNPGGDFNEAYAVHTLVVDASTGGLVSQFQHTATGYELASPPDRTPRDDGSATAIRRETYSKL